jgi:phosphoribosylanthranilate isomerase
MNYSRSEAQVPRPGTEVDKSAFLIKVCGITLLEDAVLSVEAGANALGFNFYPKSPRFIEPLTVAQIVGGLPKEVLRVGIFVDEPGFREETCNLREIIQAGVDAIQIHGVKSEAELPNFGMRTIVATSPETANRFPHHEIVIDTSWGSGVLADWKLICDLLDRPYILSGGLTPENIGDALRILEPAGVDVCSGVEATPGKKDPEKLLNFLSIVRSYCDDSGSNFRQKED